MTEPSVLYESEGANLLQAIKSGVPKAGGNAAQARGAAAITRQRDVLKSGESIIAKRSPNENRRAPHLASRNNRAWLVLQSDGNLVLSTPEGRSCGQAKRAAPIA